MTLRPAGFIPLPGGAGAGFDHADTYLADSASRLFVAHTGTNAVDVIDCAANQYLRSIPGLPGVAGVLIDSEQDLLFTSDRAATRMSVYRCSDESLLARVAVGPRPNGLAYDPVQRRLFCFNLGGPAGTNCSASVISLDERRVVKTVALPGRPRWAVFDRTTDGVYVNIQQPAVVLRIDADELETVGGIEVGCDGPHGLALVDGRLFCAADGGELVVIDGLPDRARVVKRLSLRGAPDVVWYAQPHPRVYVAIGTPGVVTAFDTETLEEVETVETETGAHTLGWDPATSQLYVFAPQRGGALAYTEDA